MISAINSQVSFGKAKSRLEQKKSANARAKLGAQAGVLLGYGAGITAINKYAMGKSFGWNTAINNAAKTFAASTKEFFGAEFLKNAAKNLSWTSGRQKLLAGATLLAIGAFVKVSEHFAKKQGELNAA